MKKDYYKTLLLCTSATIQSQHAVQHQDNKYSAKASLNQNSVTFGELFITFRGNIYPLIHSEEGNCILHNGSGFHLVQCEQHEKELLKRYFSAQNYEFKLYS